MFISKLTVQISSLYFMIILFTNTLLCVELVENAQNEPMHNNNVNDNNGAQSAKNLLLTSWNYVKSGACSVTSFVFRKTKETASLFTNQIAKPKVVQKNHDPTKRVQEPFIENRSNGFFLAEGLILYFVEFFCQNNYYIQDTDTELIQKFSERLKKIDARKRNEQEKNASGNGTDNNTTANSSTGNNTTTAYDNTTTNGTTTNNNTANVTTNNTNTENNNADNNNTANNTTATNATATVNDITPNNTTTDNTTSTKDKSDADLQKVFPSGVHLLTEKCFENGFLKCKDSDHTKEIFDLIFKDDEQIANLISVDEQILKNVINYKKKYTISENNKIVEFIKLLDINKPNDIYDRLEKSNKNGYNLIYPKCNSSVSLLVCLLKGVIAKLKMNYEENEKRNKKRESRLKSVVQNICQGLRKLNMKMFGKNVTENSVARQENAGQNVTEQALARQENVGQNVTEQALSRQENVGQNVIENNVAEQESVRQNVTEQALSRQESAGQNVIENSVAEQESVVQNMCQGIKNLGMRIFGKNVTDNSEAGQNMTEQALTNNQDVPPVNDQKIPPVNNQEIPPFNTQDVPPVNDQEIPPVNNQEIPSVNNQDLPPLNNHDVPPVNNNYIPLRELEID
ncbi:Protein with DEXDc plus ring plus HELICc [Nosema bombycis CQ1]|uniref:Protein with DEXDc plus ring plus HELICc n=1 Tax=Nosema bombycis (strain CQ1 / CVCC 102059) TaxID=578461 RepID=R0M3D7_NOSB1|nr:Protein with DEXDc plus ring plus HELICc [Nosema bombycis CQ1]|eukprot:EOB12529.1 Protein with DEXDc plus ring plus HELICc [Nosema bombycis CQ1]